MENENQPQTVEKPEKFVPVMPPQYEEAIAVYERVIKEHEPHSGSLQDGDAGGGKACFRSSFPV